MAKKRIESAEEYEADTEPRVYELGFHLDPDLPAEGAKEAYQAIRSRIEAAGTIVGEGEPVKIGLAYTITRQEPAGRRDFDAAYFSWIAYAAPVEAHEEIIEVARADTRIIRLLDITTTKDSVRHAVEREELANAKAPEAPESSADAALDAALESAVI